MNEQKAITLFLLYVFGCVAVVAMLTLYGVIDIKQPLYRVYFWLTTIVTLYAVCQLTKGNVIGSLLVSFLTGWCIWPMLVYRLCFPPKKWIDQ